MSTIPPPEPRHGITELLRLVGAVRHIAHDRTIEPDDALRRIRDAFHEYDHQGGIERAMRSSPASVSMPGAGRSLLFAAFCGSGRDMNTPTSAASPPMTTRYRPTN